MTQSLPEKIIDAIKSTIGTPLSLINDIYLISQGQLENNYDMHPVTLVSPLRADEHVVCLGLAKKVYVANYFHVEEKKKKKKANEEKGYYESIFLVASDCRTSQPYFDNTNNQEQPRNDDLWVYFQEQRRSRKGQSKGDERPMFELEDMSPLGSVLLYIAILCAHDPNPNLEPAQKVLSLLLPEDPKKFLTKFFTVFKVLMEHSTIRTDSHEHSKDDNPDDNSIYKVSKLNDFRTAFQGIVEEIIPGLLKTAPGLPQTLEEFNTDSLLLNFEYNPTLKHQCPLIESFLRNGPFFKYTDDCYSLSIGLKYFLSISENPSEIQMDHFESIISDEEERQGFVNALNRAIKQLKNNRLPKSVHEKIANFGVKDAIDERNFDEFKEFLCFDPKSEQEWIGISLMEVFTRGHNSFIHDVTRFLNVPVKTITDLQAFDPVGFNFKSLKTSLFYILDQNKGLNEKSELLFRATLTKFPYTYILHPLIGGPLAIMRKRIPYQEFDSFDRRMEEIPMMFKRYLEDQIFFLTAQQMSIINENIIKTGKTEGMKQLILYAMENAIHKDIKSNIEQEALDAFFPPKEEMTITQLDAFNTYELIKTSLESPFIFHACSMMDCLSSQISMDRNIDLKGIKMICPEMCFRNWMDRFQVKQLLESCKDDFKTKEEAQSFISLAHKLMLAHKDVSEKLTDILVTTKNIPISIDEEAYYNGIIKKWSIPQFLFQFKKAREMLSLPGTL